LRRSSTRAGHGLDAARGLSVLVEKIRARFEDCIIGLGTGGIRCSASAIR
jgi:hypothetical protein